jgi:hypothetical protein
MHRFLFTSGNLIFSLLLGAVAMAICAVWYEETFAVILDAAGRIKMWLTNLGVPTRYNNFIRLLVHESNLVFMFFTVAARLIVSAVGNLLVWLFWRGGTASP